MTLTNTGGVPFNIDKDLTIGFSIEARCNGGDYVEADESEAIGSAETSRGDRRRRLVALAPGASISRIIWMNEGWKVFVAGRGSMLLPSHHCRQFYTAEEKWQSVPLSKIATITSINCIYAYSETDVKLREAMITFVGHSGQVGDTLATNLTAEVTIGK